MKRNQNSPNRDTVPQMALFEIEAETPSQPQPPLATSLQAASGRKTSTPSTLTREKPVAKTTASSKATSLPSPSVTKTPSTTRARTSSPVPEGDVRLTANIREDLHLRLKIAAARQRTTIGELIEQWVENSL